MNKVRYVCDMCGKTFERYPCQMKGKKHCFCSRECLWAFSSKSKNPEGYAFRDFTKNSERFSELNRRLNPTRMTPETRGKLRQARLGTGEGRTYTKVYGRHEHRVVAELLLGRPLRPGEVVHHIDEDKRNNSPENLIVFPSQKEHAAYHARMNRFFGLTEGGDLK